MVSHKILRPLSQVLKQQFIHVFASRAEQSNHISGSVPGFHAFPLQAVRCGRVFQICDFLQIHQQFHLLVQQFNPLSYRRGYQCASPANFGQLRFHLNQVHGKMLKNSFLRKMFQGRQAHRKVIDGADDVLERPGNGGVELMHRLRIPVQQAREQPLKQTGSDRYATPAAAPDLRRRRASYASRAVARRRTLSNSSKLQPGSGFAVILVITFS